MSNFTLDRSFLNDSRLQFIPDMVPIHQHLDNLERFINEAYPDAVQSGRVIALRHTDTERKSSAFKASLYLGKYNDMDNADRFLHSMVSAGHSYEPIRGESIAFLFIGVGKPVYDHLTTYTVGRYSRIAGGQRANLPWGFELPVEAKNPDEYADEVERIRAVARLAKQERVEQMQAARAKLPVGYIMPPFMLEFSEETLIKTIFRQRLFERGAQGATVDVVTEMLNCCLLIDEAKWNTLIEYHGPHIDQWKKTMRTIQKERPSLGSLLDKSKLDVTIDGRMFDIDLYDLLIEHFGKMPKSMWEKGAV